jgi:predicted ATPase/class 3 adenylate cyclase
VRPRSGVRPGATTRHTLWEPGRRPAAATYHPRHVPQDEPPTAATERLTPGSAAPVTFLLTDIEGSTRLWEEHGEAMGASLQDHDRILRDAVEAAGGRVVKTTGDGLLAAFDDAGCAVLGAIDGQRSLARNTWGATGPLRVRMALHTGPAEERDADYFGPAVNRVARLLAIGHGGQVLLSGTAATLIRDDLPAGLELRDHGEHRLRDLDRAQRVFSVLAPDLPHDFPPLRSLGAFGTNLPSQLTSFVGREHELAEVRELAEGHRLVTLIGTGGTGKTRLMLQAGAELLDRYPNGVWLVELAALTDPVRVVPQMSRSLGIADDPDRPALDTLTDYCRSKSLAILLDNCEHLVVAAAEAVEHVLAACPDVSVIATSREALGAPGEVVFQVPSLGLPEDGSSTRTLAEVGASEAVRLFVERAAAVEPGFVLSPANAGPISEICRRLDGIPLAIELAAARVTVLSPEEIAAGLNDRFRLLTGGRRTALPRQQTLQALVDWSWDLLTPDDQRLLARLSVFTGGWTLEAAAVVAGTDDEPATSPSAVSRMATLDGLSRLVDRSLVLVEHAETTRYRMLETIRQYARERLIGSGTMQVIRDRHLACFLDLALSAEPGLRGQEMISWLRRLDAERENLLSAIDWGSEADAERAVRMTLALVQYWRARAGGPESVELLTRAADLARGLPRASGDTTDREVLVSLTLSAAAFAQAMWGSAPAAIEFADDALARARATGDARALAEAYTAATVHAVFSGRMEDGRAAFQEALKRQGEGGDPVMIISLQGMSAMEAAMGGDAANVEASVAEIMETARRSGNPQALAFAALNAGRSLGYVGRLDEARPWFSEALERYEEMGDRRMMLVARSDLAHVLRANGALEEAEDRYRETLRGWHHLGHRGAIAHQLESLGSVSQSRAEPLRAARLLGAAEVLREQSGSVMLDFERAAYEPMVAGVRAALGEVAFAAAWADGRAMGLDAAVELALAELGPSERPGKPASADP